MGWLRALHWPAFRRVLLASTMQQFGYWFCSISFQWLVARQTGSDPLALSLLYFSMLAPMLMFALPAGVLADVRNRRQVLICAQFTIMVLGATIATLVFAHRAPLGVLMVCGFAVGVVHTFSVPSSQALCANAVPAQDLRSGVLLNSAGMNLARIIGPAVAGALILAFGAAEPLLGYGGVGVATAFVLRGVRSVGDTRATPQQGLTARIRAGFSHARSHPPAATALSIVAATSVFALSYFAQLPALAARVSPNPSAFLVLATVGAVGSTMGVLIVALRRAMRPTVTPAALMLAVQGCVVIGLALSHALWLTVPLVIVGGAMQFGIMTHCNTVIQDVVDDDHRGRVMSLYLLCWGGLLPVGGLLLGTVWHFAGPVVALGGSGVVSLAYAAIVLRPGAVRTAPDSARSGLGEAGQGVGAPADVALV